MERKEAMALMQNVSSINEISSRIYDAVIGNLFMVKIDGIDGHEFNLVLGIHGLYGPFPMTP